MTSLTNFKASPISPNIPTPYQTCSARHRFLLTCLNCLCLFISHHCPSWMGLFLYFRLFSYLMTVNLDGCSRQYILQILLKNPIKHPKSKCNFLSKEHFSSFKNINFTYAQYDFWHPLLNLNVFHCFQSLWLLKRQTIGTWILNFCE